ncbi:MAG: hypothetical protein AABZ60_00485 [Planctomycetota bacterium]
MNSRFSNTRHFSVIELMVSMSIFTMVIGVAYQLLFSAQQNFQQQFLKQTLEFQQLQTIQQLNREFLGISNIFPGIAGITFPAVPGLPLPTSFNINYPNAVPLITYSKVVGWNNAIDGSAIPPTPGPLFASSITYFFNPAPNEIDNNNIDDNSNGFIDEGDLYKLYDEGSGYKTQLVCNHLKKRLPSGTANSTVFLPDKLSGIRFSFDEALSTITVEITLHKLGRDGRLYQSTGHSITKLRNSN